MNLNYLQPYMRLMRLDKPIGISLLLWPTAWALWLAGSGQPDITIVVIFVMGVVLMRSAGCILNDLADRHVDGQVARTRDRPLVSGEVSVQSSIVLAASLSLIAFTLVCFCNALTIMLAVLGACWVMIYPLLKRVTYLPQLGLGVAFSWGVPMAFAALTNHVGFDAWFLFATAVVWPVIYDTMYAMVDREDDVRAGIKSTALLFAEYDRWIIALLQGVFLLMLVEVGWLFSLSVVYYIALVVVAFLFMYQQWLIRSRDRQAYFAAFLNNHWVGLVIFVGILLT